MVADKRQQADLVLKKHVGLIHCENKLTLIQRKMCNILLFNALDKINEQEIHEISLKNLCSLVGYNSNDINLIKASLKSLISVVMEWNLLEDNKFLIEAGLPEEAITWTASALLAGASIRKGLIKYSYSPQIKSVLSSLDIYGRINLFVQAKFNSAYSLVLYENCVRFKNIKQTTWFSLPLFRSLMGVAKEKYPSFKEFKRNVINVAVKEINQKSDICIDSKFRKIGRQIVAVQFLLADNESYQPTFKRIQQILKTDDPPMHEANFLDILLKEFQLSLKQAKQILHDYDRAYVVDKMQLVRKNPKIVNKAAYLLAALKNDYLAKQTEALRQNAPVNCIRQYQEASQISSLKKKYLLYKLNCYTKFISLQTESMQKKIRDGFAAYLRPNAELYKNFKKKGFFSPVVISEFIRFIDENAAFIVRDYLSFEDYITAEEDAIT